jgi:hypothetical protein
VTCWSVPSAGQKIPIQSGWYLLPPQKIPLAEKEVSSGKVRELKIQRKKFQAVLYGLD